MPRGLAYLDPGGGPVETCTRTIQGYALLRPGPEEDELTLGVLGRALDYYRVDLYAFAFASNHYHLLYGAESQLQVSRFQCYVNGNLAKEIGGHHGWGDKFWSRRYRPLGVSEEPEAQIVRLKYLLAAGTKEGLIASPYDWPGPSAAKAIVRGEPLVGYWFNRTKEWEARRRGETFGKYDYATRYEIVLQQIPGLAHLTPEEYRAFVADLVRVIEEEAAERRGDRPVLGAQAILAQNPLKPLPSPPKKSPAPKLFYAATPERGDAMRQDYKDFGVTYRIGADQLRAASVLGGGFEPAKEFPQGCFPPALTFIGRSLPAPPPRPPTRWLRYKEPGSCKIVERGPIPTICVPRRAEDADASASVVTPPPLSRGRPGSGFRQAPRDPPP